MKEENGLFRYPLWVKRRIRKESINEGIPKKEDSGAGVGNIMGNNKSQQHKGILKKPKIEMIDSEGIWLPFDPF